MECHARLEYNLQSNALWNYSVYELLRLVPKPTAAGDDVQIYNINAWHRLGNVLIELPTTKTNTTRTVRLCSIGGSATAGGGGVPSEQKWDERYIEMLQSTGISSNPLTTVQVVNRAHGARGSVHAAFVMHSIVPADVDIIVWEFAINDGHNNGCQEVNNGIILWLDQIQKMWPDNPPLVLLAYLWDPGVANNANRTIGDTVFQCHGHLAAAYDFVVGSVHLGSYIRNLPFDFDSVSLFLADEHHPNVWGHWFLAYLLWDLTTDTTRSPMASSNKLLDSNGTLPRPLWNCSVVPTKKKRVNELLATKSAFASWTAEVPRNEENGDHNQGMLIPYYLSKVNSTTVIHHHNISYVVAGKSADWRMDRKRSVVLPCCSTHEGLCFDLTNVVVQDQWTSAIQVYAPDVSTARNLSRSILVEFFDSTGSQLLGNPPNGSLASWVTYQSDECRVGHWFLNTWLVFQKPQPAISQLVFCNSRPECGADNVPPVTIMHVVLY